MDWKVLVSLDVKESETYEVSGITKKFRNINRPREDEGLKLLQ